MLANRLVLSLPATPRRPLNLASRIADGLGRALHNHATRRYLAEMDDRTLADLGISRAHAQFEASRWAWDWSPDKLPPRRL